MHFYLIRPNLSSILFDNEAIAQLYIKRISAYKGLDFWYAANHDGKIRVFCNNHLKISPNELNNFPEPYQIISTFFN